MFKYRNFVSNVYAYDLSDKEIYYISTDKEIMNLHQKSGQKVKRHF